MSDPARIVDVGNAVAADIAARWTPSDPDGVTATWAARVSLAVDDPVTLLTGRRVFVIYGEPAVSPLTREHKRNGYVIGVLLVERYTAEGDPPDSWLSDRVKWWQDTILYPLCDPSLTLAGPGGIVTAARPDPEQPPEIVAFLDREILVEGKAMLIQVNFSFMDASNNAGEG